MFFFKKIFGIAIILIFIISCERKTNIEKIEEVIILNNSAIEYELTLEDILNILYTEENYLRGRYTEILFLQKVNFGVPDGNNYIVQWKSRREGTYDTITLILYSISNKIERRYFLGGGLDFTNNFQRLMENIPGIHITTALASIYDFNNDGLDELLNFGFYGMGRFLEIMGYDIEKDEIVYFTNNIEFHLSETPLEFINFKNMDGFKILTYYDHMIPAINIIDSNYAWYFFSWNNDRKQFENISEYLSDENIIYDIFDFSITHFRERIFMIMSNMEILRDVIEVNAEILGGRSFIATIESASDGNILNNTFHFDSEGKLANRKWD